MPVISGRVSWVLEISSVHRGCPPTGDRHKAADTKPTGTAARCGAPQVGALVGGVARPVGPGAAGGTGFVFEGHDGEEREN